MENIRLNAHDIFTTSKFENLSFLVLNAVMLPYVHAGAGCSKVGLHKPWIKQILTRCLSLRISTIICIKTSKRKIRIDAQRFLKK